MVYSIQELFTTYLSENNTVSYLIPTYQRGYKWSSEGGQVEKLLTDVFDEYRISESKDYFLNFLTLKKNKDQFEVVDGQQRLTTLAILLSVINHFIKSEDNYSKHKLNYESRKNFLDNFIYDDIEKLINYESWNDFVSDNDEEMNQQDVFYLYNAVHCIYNFFSDKTDKVGQYSRYLSKYVKIVAYPFDDDRTGERLFINVNKGVELTEEDLVKAFIILGVLDKKQKDNRHIPTYDVNEERATLGRRWDNLARWTSLTDIRAFYNIPPREEVGNAVWLINLCIGHHDITQTNGLFDRVEKYQRENILDSHAFFMRLEGLQSELDDWYKDDKTHNIIGYLMHIKSEQKKDLLTLISDLSNSKSKADVTRFLKAQVKSVIEKSIVIQTNTKDGKVEIELPEYNKPYQAFNILLLMEIWRFLNPENDQFASRNYNFEGISGGDWTLEHIFPQTPGDFRGIESFSFTDVGLLMEIVPKNAFENETEEDILIVWKELKEKNKQKKDFQIGDRKEQIIKILKQYFDSLHRLGNLALLSREINSSLSNGFFQAKRQKIFNAVSSGKFVPYHTYDVFAKLLNPKANSLMLWTKEDMKCIEKYIKMQIEQVINYLK